MARTLKYDKVLFTATLLLVCASVVMVYSASAIIALERFQQPYLFLTKQVMWVVLGLAVLAIAMRVGVLFRRASMRGPTRVANAVSAVDRAEPNRFFEIAQFAFGATDLEFVTFVDDRDAS